MHIRIRILGLIHFLLVAEINEVLEPINQFGNHGLRNLRLLCFVALYLDLFVEIMIKVGDLEAAVKPIHNGHV